MTKREKILFVESSIIGDIPRTFRRRVTKWIFLKGGAKDFGTRPIINEIAIASRKIHFRHFEFNAKNLTPR